MDRQRSRNLPPVRRDRKMTQEALARAADLAPRTLQKLEAGEFSCLISTLRRLRRALNCSFDDLLPHED